MKRISGQERMRIALAMCRRTYLHARRHSAHFIDNLHTAPKSPQAHQLLSKPAVHAKMP